MDEERKEPDWFPNAKVYHNGSHYIGIPHTTNKRKKRPKPQEKVFVVREEIDKETGEVAVKSATILPKLELMDDDECPDCPFEEEIEEYYRKKNQGINTDMVAPFKKKERKVKTKRVTRAGEFKRLYEECKNMKVKDQKKYLMNCIRDLFPDLRAAELYVERKLMDK